MNEEKRDEAIKMAIKLYPHKHGDELAMEIIWCLDRLSTSEREGKYERRKEYLSKLYSESAKKTDNEVKDD